MESVIPEVLVDSTVATAFETDSRIHGDPTVCFAAVSIQCLALSPELQALIVQWTLLLLTDDS